ncbi:MAG: phosphatidylserine synthase [Hyphomicrobium sp.]|uniref:phosphatidylserine synthase n=1 Tax=Hyphomicrobium sp. TaxID=82 RepID=UPI001320D13E|nr:phosphatidylserine synthase [Hyphomicrobium sp.]KAB2943509.1 MAG: phosphatidylserine synthase [Hyphomicrobium sp.]MBZ0208776.1 phosphatidylserine synthase [Hyphomicrobium sp.]
MTKLVCIPVYRVRCQVRLHQGRAWTPVEELVLWAISKRAQTIGDLASDANLPHQVIVSALSRLMRFRFARLAVIDGAHKFVASTYGTRLVQSGDPLPFIPKETDAWISFVLERVSGRVIAARDVRRMRQKDLDHHRKYRKGTPAIVVDVTGGVLDIGTDVMIARISQFATRGRQEKLAAIEPGTGVISKEYIGVTVDNGIVRDLPESAGQVLHKIVLEAASGNRDDRAYSVAFAGSLDRPAPQDPVRCRFAPDDIVIGGSAQGTLLRQLVGEAASRLVIHSTFLRLEDIDPLLPAMRAACARGVTIDILWGAAGDEEDKTRHAVTAERLIDIVRRDEVLHRRVRVALQSTGSHAKLLLFDTPEGGWIAAVSSCNWLKSPFRSVEITTLLRHPQLVSRIAAAIGKMAGDRGLSDTLANEMALLRSELTWLRGSDGDALVDVITGEDHHRLLRRAGGEARDLLVIGTHRLGSTARPGALLPAEAAARTTRIVKVLYTQPSGPLKNRHIRELKQEAAEHGVELIQLEKPPMHGKLLLWDGDNVVTSSLNWGSAASDPDFPLGDIGVHVRSPGIATNVWSRLQDDIPQLRAPAPAT